MLHFKKFGVSVKQKAKRLDRWLLNPCGFNHYRITDRQFTALIVYGILAEIDFIVPFS
ncbi:hypothetical protein CRENPOLYSF2_160016 [Crenothrix polyspora]|uniref:Uncharacterized protein n=1 Tax=Crenothrix polyspora TaxID=360316 RepID=A0A1R4H267_9GAMM|nr:hypothetical protein CRENPOLYSF2_160016 [Crenothrix polyspora]